MEPARPARVPGRFQGLSLFLFILLFPHTTAAQSSAPSSYYAIRNRNVYPKPQPPTLGPAGWRFVDPTFGSRLLRVTDRDTRPGFPGRSYSTPSAAHQLAWNATSDRFYVRSLDGWFIPYDFDPVTMRASRIQATTTGNGGLLIQSQVVEPQFSFLSRDIIFSVAPDNTATDGINYPAIQKYDFATAQYSPIVNLRPHTTVDDCLSGEIPPSCHDTYAGALSSSATAPEKISVMFNGRGQDWHYKVAVFDVQPAGANLVVLNTKDSRITKNGVETATKTTLGFRLHHAWIDQSARWVVLYPVNASPAHVIVWNLGNDTFTPVTTRPFGHDALGYGWQVNQDCCASGAPFDGAQWQLRSLTTPQSSTDLISPQLQPQQIYIADHTSWNNARADRRVPVLSALYRYYKHSYNTTPWRAWDDEIIAIQTDAPGASTVWRFAHHRSDITMDMPGDGTYFWYQPHANISPNGRWALFTSNWEKTLGTAANAEPEGAYRTDVFIVRLLSGSFSDAPLTSGEVIKAVHFTELRGRIDILRAMYGLTPYGWTDPDLRPGITPVKAAHLTDLRTALQQAYSAAGQLPPRFGETIAGGATIIRAQQLEEVRTAVLALEGG
jgi:hypothetical protein